MQEEEKNERYQANSKYQRNNFKKIKPTYPQ